MLKRLSKRGKKQLSRRLLYWSFIGRGRFKEATHIILSRKIALSLCKKVILSTRHLFRSKNGVSKLFEIFIFFTMFMCKTQMSAGMARLSGAITFSRGLNRKIYWLAAKSHALPADIRVLHMNIVKKMKISKSFETLFFGLKRFWQPVWLFCIVITPFSEKKLCELLP